MVTEKKKNVIVPKFIMEDGYIVKGGPKLNVFLKNVYGFNRLFFNFIMRRFEFKKNLTCVHMELFDKMYIKYFRYHLPQNKDFRYRYYAHLYLMFNLKLYKAYRQIMGLPSRGQRTWSNANNPFRCNVELRALFAQKAWRIYPFLTRTYSMTAALAELSNRLWKTNWLRDWRNAKDSIEQTRRSNIVKIDLFAMSKFFNRVELSDYKISKKTKQKKKIEKKGSFTTGLEPGFAKIFLVKSARELRHINLQFYYTKTTRMIFEKDNKKSKRKGGGLKLGKGVKSIKVARRLQKKKKKISLRLIFKPLRNSDIICASKKKMQNMTLIALKLNNYNNSVFIILNIIKYKIVAVVFLIRFSRYASIYIRVCGNVLSHIAQFKKFNDIFLYSNSLKKINKNAAIFYLFSIKSSSKKNIAIASAKKKKSNLFRKYNTYKRSLLYKAQRAIKKEHFRNTNFRKALLTPHLLRNINKTVLDEQQQPISMLEINADRKKRNRMGYFTYANLSFYKKLARVYPRGSFSKFFQKKRALYKLNRHFNKRFYSNRLMLRDMYLYKNSRQFSITRFVEQFKTHKKYNVYKQLQMTLLIVLISAQFFMFKDDCILFLKKYGVFVNGKLCTNPYRVIIKGDIIQLPITSSIYSYFFKLKRVNFFYLKKFSKKLRKMYLSKKYRFRTRSYHTPKFVHKVAFVGNDIPSYLEVDFTILTIMVIYNCNTAYDINSNIADYTLLYLHRTYNWRSLA